jgi:hypothetical protein
MVAQNEGGTIMATSLLARLKACKSLDPDTVFAEIQPDRFFTKEYYEHWVDIVPVELHQRRFLIRDVKYSNNSGIDYWWREPGHGGTPEKAFAFPYKFSVVSYNAPPGAEIHLVP